jgi:hypothetical protein
MEINDITPLLTGGFGLLLSTGITMWVYKTLNSTIQHLREEVKSLKEQILELKQSEYKWYHKTHRLAAILNRSKRCQNSNECEVKKAYDKYIEEEGVI